jgi:hypothetical protein
MMRATAGRRIMLLLCLVLSECSSDKVELPPLTFVPASPPTQDAMISGVKAAVFAPSWHGPGGVRTTDSRHDLPIARACSNAISPPPRRTGSGSQISPMSRPIRAGSIWHGPGPLQSKDCQLGNVRSLAHRPAVGSFADGHLGPTAGGPD